MKWFDIITGIAIGIELFSPTAHAAATESRGDYYKSAYVLLGTYLRGAKVCDNEKFVYYGFHFVSSKEFRAFSAAYPKTIEKWMAEGAQSFNSGVMSAGIPTACQFLLFKMIDDETGAKPQHR